MFEGRARQSLITCQPESTMLPGRRKWMLIGWGWMVSVVIAYDPGYPECKISPTGREYRGYLNTTKSGQTCQPWKELLNKLSICANKNGNTNPESTCRGSDQNSQCNDNSNHEKYSGRKHSISNSQEDGDHKMINGGRGGEEKSLSCLDGDILAENYCRNPDGRDAGPWCFVDSEAQVSENCQVRFCKPSASCLTSPSGVEYVGTLSSTKSGLPCQRWDHTTPHKNQYLQDTDFPDGSVTAAGNHCRNPRGDRSRPWCYTLDPHHEWQYCDVKLCLACYRTRSGSDYAGTRSHTKSGHQCSRWDEDEKLDPDQFPDRNLQTASNYCRNPDGRPGGPWCYTGSSDVPWESCGLDLCRKDPPQPVRHVIHIGIDGLHRCTNTTTLNITSRLARAGASTYQARTLMNSLTGPCWTGILCSLTAESSGVLDNSWLPPWRGHQVKITPTTGSNVPFPCIFDVLKHQDENIRTAAFHSWTWFNFLLDRMFPDNPDPELACTPNHIPFNGSQVEHYGDCDKQIANQSMEYLKNILPSSQGSYTFLYFGNSDVVGHMYGWCGEEYLQEVKVLDGYVGRVLDLVDSLDLQEEVMIVLSTDHGGEGYIHWNYEDSDLLVPLFFKGPGIKKNFVMSNNTRNIDIAPTILHAMGYKSNRYWDGTVLEDIFVD